MDKTYQNFYKNIFKYLIIMKSKHIFLQLGKISYKIKNKDKHKNLNPKFKRL